MIPTFKELPAEYQSDFVLKESPVYFPQLAWALPGQLKFDYASRFERILLDLVMTELQGEVIEYSTGFNPGYDAIVRFNGETKHRKVEIKTSQNHMLSVESGRHDLSQSGLSSTEADVWITLTHDVQMVHGAIGRHVGKLRVVTLRHLVEEYHNAKELVYQPNAYGPGSRCFKLDSKKRAVVWVGDVACSVDDNHLTMYDLSKVTRRPRLLVEAMGLLANELELHDIKMGTNHDE